MPGTSSARTARIRAPVAFDSAIATDVGKVREKNEDSSLLIEDQGLFVVADGMGGHNSGEIASQICVESIKSFFESDSTTDVLETAFEAHKTRRQEGQRSRTYDEFRLWKALEAANLHIYNTAKRYPQFRDMGTTVVAVQAVGNRAYVGWVGDSRVYRVRGARIEQLTEDHSLANEYVKMKILRKEDLPRFPYKNVIVRALGLSERVKVDTFYKECKKGDRYILCSDGLTDLVGDDEIKDIVLAASSSEQACQALVDTANSRGGVDNITVLVVHLFGSGKGRSSRSKPRRST